MGKVYIIGTGPGSNDYLLPLVKRLIEGADVVIGSKRLLNLVHEDKRAIQLENNYSRALEYIKKNANKRNIAVLVSGCPGMFSISRKITAVLDESQYQVIPGISSLQLACARIGQTWDNLFVVSVHGKNLRGLDEKVKIHKKIMIFCDDKNTPSYVARYLTRKISAKIKIIAFGNLSLPGEEIIRTNIASLAGTKREWKGLWLLLIQR